MNGDLRLAIVCSHPIQYFSPWFRWLSEHCDIRLKVFFLDNPQLRRGMDVGFAQPVAWDVPLLENFDHTFVKNRAKDPGSHHYAGLNNPTLWGEIATFSPDMTLLMCYHYRSILPAMLRGTLPDNTWLRGDSVLAPARAGLRRWLADKIIRRAFSQLTGALYVGQKNRDYFMHHGLHSHQLQYSPPAVALKPRSSDDRSRQQGRLWRRGLGIPDNHKVVLFVGKLQQIKRPAMLLRAFKNADVENSSLVFAGSGEDADGLLAAAAGDHRIHLLGFQNQSALPEIYAGADLLVLPSVTETWGLVVNEAFAFGTGALVSDAVGCATDLVAGQGTGTVFASDNLDALTRELKASLTDPNRLKQWGRTAQALVNRDFSFRSMSSGLGKALMQSVAAKAPGNVSRADAKLS
ncbi:MAG: glycosyltransferase family 4 protein [Lysobacterales bacterium]